MTIEELQEKRNAALDQRKELHDKALSEDREFTEDEKTQFDEWEKEADTLTSRIERAEKIEAEQLKLSAPTGRVTQPQDVRVEVGHDLLADDPCGGFGRKEDLPHAFGQFAADIYFSKDKRSDRLVKWDQAWRGFAAGDGLGSSIGHEGAYLLPTAFGALIDRIQLENAIIRPRATRIPMTAKSISFPSVDDTTHAGGTVFGGVVAYFKSEEAQLTESKPSFADSELTVHKLTVYAVVNNELLDWSPISLGTWLPTKMAQCLTWKEEDKFISGNGGAGEPTGLLNAMCVTPITIESGQAAATILLDNIIKMDARLWDVAGRNSVIWIANRTCKTELPKLVLTDGANSVPVFLPADGAAGRPLSTLYGYPIVFTEHAQALGTVGDIMLCNVGEYLIGDASGKTRSDRNMGLKFDYDQEAFRLITYVGGMCPWRSAFTPQHGDTLSPVITLAVRE